MEELIINPPLIEEFKEQIKKLPLQDIDPEISAYLKGPNRKPLTQQEKDDALVYEDLEDSLDDLPVEEIEQVDLLSVCAIASIPFYFGPSTQSYIPSEWVLRKITEEEVYEDTIKKIIFDETVENVSFMDFVATIKSKDDNVYNYFTNLGVEKVTDLMQRAREEMILSQNLYRI